MAIGYLLIFFLLISSTFIANTLENKIQRSSVELKNFLMQKSMVEQIYQAARDRSSLLLKIVNTSDPFEIDEYSMKFYAHAEQVRLAFQTYLTFETTDEENRLLNELFDMTAYNRELQNQVVELALNYDREGALKFLIEETIPIQEHVLTLFQILNATKESQLHASQEKFYKDLIAIKSFWASTLVILLSTLAVVAFFSIKKLRYAQKIQADFQSKLTQAVNDRTKEIVLDSAVLQNIHESIAVTTEKGELIKTNLKFNELLHKNGFEKEYYIWSILPKLFEGINSDRIFENVTRNGKDRQEAVLKSNQNNYYLIDAHQIHDVRLDYTYLSFLLTDITHLKETQNELESLANYDAITGLANRYLFQRTVKSWVKLERPFSLFFIDLDNFKWVNDTQGHAAGDAILKTVANILSKTFSDTQNNLVARLGGDEFAIISSQFNELSLAKLSNNIIDSIKQEFKAVNPSQTLGCSIGIACHPRDGKNIEDLMRHADFAMYKAKEEGKNCYRLFSDQMNEHIHYLYETELKLHHALKNKEFYLVYQPQYRLDSLEVVGAEALLRLKTDERDIPPGEFIPLAEKFGLIQKIGDFVVEEALKQLKTWQNNDHTLQRIAINVSSAQLTGHSFTELVKRLLHLHKLKPNQLDIEITESLLMDHFSEGNQALNELQQKGLEISIDDFGTGYSSLAYIKHLNVNRIKIDQSFIRDLGYNTESYSIVSAIITMGHSLGMKVLAEGIEEVSQLEILRELGCDEGQGYLLSRPFAADQVDFSPAKIEG